MSDATKLAKRLAAFAPLAVLLVAVNVLADPAHLFDGGRTVRTIAGALESGYRVTGTPNYNERDLQRQVAAQEAASPGVLVLGSSRAMTLGSAEIGAADVRNAAVSGASLLDMLGTYDVYLRRGVEPRRVVLSIDPWMFNAHAGDTRWTGLASECTDMLARLGLPAPDPWVIAHARLSRAATLVSLDYFQQGILELLGTGARNEVRATQRDSNVGPTWRPDGTFVYGEDIRHLSPDEVLRAAEAYAATSPMYQLGSFTRIDPADSAMFVRFLRALTGRGVAVTVFLPPYHPVVSAVLRRDPRYALVATVERMVRDVAAGAGVRVCGSYDPVRLSLTRADFYDGMHAREQAQTRIFSSCRPS